MHDFKTVDWEEILKAKRLDIILSDSQMQQIIEKLDNTIDTDGYIINKDGERELSIDSSEIKTDDVGAVLPGSKVFIKKNIAGFSQYLHEYFNY